MDNPWGDLDGLWAKAHGDQYAELESLPDALRQCLLDGDGLADHYGGRTAFLFAEQQNDRILTLEKPEAGASRVRVFPVINCTGGYGTGILGSQITLLEKVVNQALQRSATSNDEFHSPERHRLVAKLRRLVAQHTQSDGKDWELSFTSTGTEAMDLAMQLVMLDGFDLGTGRHSLQQKNVLIACHGAWHGWGLNPNQLLDRRQFTEGLPRLRDHEVVFMRYADPTDLEAVFERNRGRVRGVFVEGILGDGGVVRASDDWWRRLFELARGEDAKVVDDEILTGFRCGRALALPAGLSPDCITLGKALGFGLFPLSAVIWRKDRLKMRPGIGVRTFNARPFQARIVTAGLELIENGNLFERTRVLGEKVLLRLQQLVERHPDLFKAARGMGFFFGLELSGRYARKGHALRNQFLRHGVLTEVESGLFNQKVPKHARINETIRLTPALGMREDDLAEAVERLERAAQTFLESGGELA